MPRISKHIPQLTSGHSGMPPPGLGMEKKEPDIYEHPLGAWLSNSNSLQN